MNTIAGKIIIGCFFGGIVMFVLKGTSGETVQTESLPYYTGTILPMPQEAAYEDGYWSLAKVGLALGSGVNENDMRVKLLQERIAAVGGQAELLKSGVKDYTCMLELREGKEGLPPGVNLPQEAEGYVITPTKSAGGEERVLLAGCDRPGLLWAVISAGQVMRNDKGKAEMRRVKVRDYPAVKRRGFYPGIWRGTTARDWAWYGVQFKFNVFVFNYLVSPQTDPERSALSMPGGFRGPWPEGWTNDLQAVGEVLSELGLEWYLGCLPVHCALVKGQWTEKVRSGDEADIGALVRIGEALADAGGNLFLRYDDVRFPISPADKARFGTAREADVYLLNRIYETVRRKYPSFKLLFCPPFYWGPECDPFYCMQPGYPESREQYLAALGSRLPKDIGIFWTGPRVWGREKTKMDVAWITNLIQRNPWVWQNASDSPHMYLYHYATDPVRCWKDWHYEGFFDDVNVYLIDGYNEAAVTLADCLWNPGAYDAERSVREMNTKICGPDAWPALQALNEKLSYFDQYRLQVTPGAIHRKAEIAAKWTELETAWQKCLAVCSESSLSKWTMLSNFVDQQKAFAGQVAGAKLSYFDEKARPVQDLAKTESGYDPGLDILLTPYDFFGGMPARLYDGTRLATWIYGSNTVWHEMTAEFALAVKSAMDYRLVLSAQDGDSFAPCRIEILVNGHTIFKGENPFPKFKWTCHDCTIPAACLTGGQNAIVIRNTEPGGILMAPPWFMLNYALIKKEPLSPLSGGANKPSDKPSEPPPAGGPTGT